MRETPAVQPPREDDVTQDAPAAEMSSAGSVVGTTVWTRSSSTAYVEHATHVSVVDLDHLDLPPYVFEGSAAQVWACVDGDRTETEIVADLAEAYDAPTEVVAADVRRFLDRLGDLGLIVPDGGTGVG